MPARFLARVLALLALVLTLAAPAAIAATFIRVQQQFAVPTDSTSQVAVSFPIASSNVLTAQALMVGGSFRQFSFEAPDHAPLAVGTYRNAQGYPYQAAGHAGLDVRPQCEYGHGWFTIHELTVGANRTVTSFAADFEFHCYDGPFATYGAVRFNSSVPYVAFQPEPIPAFKAQFFSEPGDSVGGGRAWTSSANITGQVINNRVSFVSGLGSSAEGFSAEFGGPNGKLLVPGVYENAGSDGRAAYLNVVAGFNYSCNTAAGRMVVHEIEVDQEGLLRKFAVDFEQHCDSASSKALFGAFRYNSSVPPIADPRHDVTLPPGPAAATVLQNLTLNSRLEADRGQTLSFTVARTVDATGRAWGQQPVQASTTCGSFNGQSTAQILSDGSGDVPIKWTPPSDRARTKCQIMLELMAFTHPVITIDVDIFESVPTVTTATIYISSQAGDATYNGGKATLSFSGTETGGYGGIRGISFVGNALIVYQAGVDPSKPPAWYFVVAPRRAATATTEPPPLAPGAYEDAQLYPVNQPGHPGLSVWHPLLQGCDSVTGRFVVHEFVQGSFGRIATLAVDIEQHCNGSGAAFRAGIRYNSTVPYTEPPAGTVVTTATGSSPSGGSVALAIASATAGCTLASANFMAQPSTAAPAGVAYPHGALDLRTANCGSGQAVTFNVDFPQDLPPTAQWMKYGPTPDNRTPHWYAIASTVSGRRITFTITDGGEGDDDLTANGLTAQLGMLAIPGGMYQDVWWSGVVENGWGISIVQHREVLFANVFVYDSQGKPVWYVMPSGSWNAAHTTYTGSLFLPKGAPFYAYDVSKFDIGASVGTATLTFQGVNAATFAYTINGSSAAKSVSRIGFGPVDAPTERPLADLWWAGDAQNGWGIALLQQYRTLFALWFTYDADGKATWFVMPGGSWTGKYDYAGKIYRPEGAPWLGVTYDASRHRTVEAGSYRMFFSADGVTCNFDYIITGGSRLITLTRIPF